MKGKGSWCLENISEELLKTKKQTNESTNRKRERIKYTKSKLENFLISTENIREKKEMFPWFGLSISDGQKTNPLNVVKKLQRRIVTPPPKKKTKRKRKKKLLQNSLFVNVSCIYAYDIRIE